jgi:hypothetical protein
MQYKIHNADCLKVLPVLQPSFEVAWGKEVSTSERGAEGGIARSE